MCFKKPFLSSPRCYLYLRKKFHLPSVAMIRKWTASVTALPSFQTQAFNELKKKVESDPNKYSHVTLMLDGIHLKTKKELVSGINKVFGMEDLGNISPVSKLMGPTLKVLSLRPVLYHHMDTIFFSGS